VYDGSQMRVYLNGVLDGTTSQTGPISDSDAGIEIGRRRRDFIDGVIDEVRISAEALGAGEFNLLPMGGATPPALVTNFAASNGADGQSVLTWTNPSDGDLGQVVVKRKTGSYPTSRTDGTTVYDNASPTPGAPISSTNTGLVNGTTYYYAVFSRDATDWNETVTDEQNADTGTPSAPAGGIAGYWELNEGSGAVAGDSSGYGNDGTIHGASWVNESPDGTTALSFDGVNDYVSVPDDATLDVTTDLTIEAWVKYDVIPSRTSYASVVSKNDAYILRVTNNRIQFWLWIGSRWRPVVGATSLATGTWYHIAGCTTGARCGCT